jgi:hypothetical protein
MLLLPLGQQLFVELEGLFGQFGSGLLVADKVDLGVHGSSAFLNRSHLFNDLKRRSYLLWKYNLCCRRCQSVHSWTRKQNQDGYDRTQKNPQRSYVAGADVSSEHGAIIFDIDRIVEREMDRFLGVFSSAKSEKLEALLKRRQQ